MNITKNKIIGILGVFVTALILILIIYFFRSESFEDVKYSLFYKPVYTLFSGGLYFPYYLESIKLLLLFLLFFIAIIYVYWGKWKEFSRLKAISTYTIIIAILVGSGYLFVRSTLTDIHYIINDTYCEEEVNLLSLDQRRSTGRGHNIYYYLGKRRLNVYQYRELKNIKDEFVLNLENFDQVVRRKEKYADLPPLQESDKRQILVSLNSSNDFIRTQTLRQLGLEIYIKVKIRYLPSSKQVLSYEVMGEVPK